MDALDSADLSTALVDPVDAVRCRAAQIAARAPAVDLIPVLDDPAGEVVEMAAWSLGERGESSAVGALARIASGHGDPLCREAAVAGIGAIAARLASAGSACPPEGLRAVLSALADRPTVRRRAVLALAPFEGAAVEEALRNATQDRDWQVRQAAEDLLGDA